MFMQTSIFPTPKKLNVKEGTFTLYNIGVYVDNAFDYRVKKAALKLREIISESTGKEIYKYLKSKSIILRKKCILYKKDTYHKDKHLILFIRLPQLTRKFFLFLFWKL